MKTVEDFKRIIAQYYNRDEEAKKEYEEQMIIFCDFMLVTQWE